MKHGAVISTAILFLLLGITAPAFAQREQQGKEQGKSDQGKQHQARPAPQPHQPQAAKPARQQHQPQAKKAAPPQERPKSNYSGAYHGGVKPTGPTYGGVHHSGIPQQKQQVHSGFGQSRAK